MGRPLRQDTIEAMGLVASGKTLSKQVGYNKYRTVEDANEIVRLAEVAEGQDVVLTLKDGEDEYAVLKITKHLFMTTGGVYPYTLNAEGKVVFEDGVTVYAENVVEQEPAEHADSEPSENTSDEEPTEPTVEEGNGTEETSTVAEEPTEEPTVEE